MRPNSKGWCPSAHRPMMSGDGLLVRIKPAYGQLSRAQIENIADLSDTFGHGLIDVTSRANLQLRGVGEAHYPALLSALKQANLVASQANQDALNLTLAPFTQPGSLGWRCAKQLYDAAADFAELPAKFGFAVDCNRIRYLHSASADIRIETDADDQLLLRCGSLPAGLPSSEADLLADIAMLTSWFSDQCQQLSSSIRQRMPDILNQQKLPEHWASNAPRPDTARLLAGQVRDGLYVVAAPYGQLGSADLRALASVNEEVYITTDRCLMLSKLPTTEHRLITNASDPRLHIAACPGQPHCQAASIQTRALADHLISKNLLPAGRDIHISGCAKGCAAATPRDLCIVGNQGQFDIVEKGCAWQAPNHTSLTDTMLLQQLKILAG